MWELGYRQNNRAKERAKVAAYRLTHLEKTRSDFRSWRRQNPEIARAACAASARKNPTARAAKEARRKAVRLKSPGRGVTAADHRRVIVDSLGLCTYCNEPKRLTVDHIEPLIRGGAHDPDNLTAACRSCNCSKNDKSLLLWLALRARDRQPLVAAA